MDRQVFRKKVMPLFTLSLVVTFISSFLGFQFIDFLSNIIVFIILAIAAIAVMTVIFVWQRESIFLLLVFNLLEGFILTPLVYIANIIDPVIVPEAFGITSIVFFVFSFVGWIIKRDLSSLAKILFALLIVALVLTIAQYFIQSFVFNMAVDIGVVLLFVVFIVYDTRVILTSYSNSDYVAATISLYLDFLNIFVRIVSILIRLRRRK
jgi:FtsH-binding integral membrane protein